MTAAITSDTAPKMLNTKSARHAHPFDQSDRQHGEYACTDEVPEADHHQEVERLLVRDRNRHLLLNSDFGTLLIGRDLNVILYRGDALHRTCDRNGPVDCLLARGGAA